MSKIFVYERNTETHIDTHYAYTQKPSECVWLSAITQPCEDFNEVNENTRAHTKSNAMSS